MFFSFFSKVFVGTSKGFLRFLRFLVGFFAVFCRMYRVSQGFLVFLSVPCFLAC